MQISAEQYLEPCFWNNRSVRTPNKSEVVVAENFDGIISRRYVISYGLANAQFHLKIGPQGACPVEKRWAAFKVQPLNAQPLHATQPPRLPGHQAGTAH